jgi:hypothetical protein
MHDFQMFMRGFDSALMLVVVLLLLVEYFERRSKNG